MLWAAVIILAAVGTVYGAGGDEQEGDLVLLAPDDHPRAIIGSGNYVEYPKSVFDRKNEDEKLDVYAVFTQYYIDLGAAPDFELTKATANPLHPGTSVRIEKIRPIFDLDLHVISKGTNKPIQDFLEVDELNSEENQVLVRYAFNKGDIAFVNELREALSQTNKDKRPVFLLFWKKANNNEPLEGYWETDIELIEQKRIEEVVLYKWGFSFRILEWPEDDPPVAIGG